MKKLVRDNIIDIMRSKNQIPNYYIVENDEEFYSFLKDKLNEEIKEFFEAENIDDKMAEMGDVLEVLFAISKFNGLNLEEVEKVRNEKKVKNGGFDKRIILVK